MKKTVIIPVTIATHPWLEYCVRSVQDNLSGYDEIVVVFCEGFEELDIPHLEGVRFEKCKGAEGIEKEYLTRSLAVMMADEFADDLAVIINANFMICRRFSLDRLIVDGKPTILCDSYAALSRLTGDVFQSVQHWQFSTERALEFDSVDLEFARVMPIMFPVSVLPNLREHLYELSGTTNMVDFLNQIDNPQVPAGFCFNEFNVIGAYLYEKAYSTINWIIMSKAQSLAKYLPPSVGVFEIALDDEEVRILIEEESKKTKYNLLTRRYLKELLKKA